MLLSLVLAAASSLFSAARGGFSSKCDTNNLSLCGNVLQASCKNDAGIASEKTFALDDCVAYSPDHTGLMWCQKDNALPVGSGCQQCALNTTTLWCVCPGLDFEGIVYNWNSVDLDDCVDVDDEGNLFCSAPEFKVADKES